MAKALIFVFALFASQLGSSNGAPVRSPKAKEEPNMMNKKESGIKSKETSMEAKKDKDYREKGREDSNEEDVTYEDYDDDFAYPSDYEEYQGVTTC